MAPQNEERAARLRAQANDPSFENVWQELRWRGLVHVSTDEAALEQALAGEPVSYYCGFDPTAPSLHLGHLVQLLTLRRLQLAGHRPYALVGGATGLIGDPRQTSERVLNSQETVAAWVESLRAQIEPYLSFEGENAATMVNNLDWTAGMSALDFLRDVGKNFRVGTMVKKEIVAKRLNSDEGISYTEFSYQVLQGNDFLELHRRHGVTLQTGGSDQWGNLTAGTELIRKVEGTHAHALGTPLITNADGTKFGKSEGNAVWLDAKMCSPYAFYQFWLNTADADVVDRLKDMIISGGENIASSEVERVIYEMPVVREVAVIGLPDERWGEKPVAIVVLADDARLDLSDLIDFCRARLAAFKVPRQLILRDSLPRNPSGKVLKRVLRAELEATA